MRRCTLLFTAALLVGSACFAPAKERNIENRIIKRLVVRGDELIIHAQPAVTLSQMLRLSVFGPLRPGMTFEEAARLVVPYGAPSQAQERPTDKLQLYRAEGGMLQIIRQEVESEGPKRISWLLRFVPADGHPEEYFAQEVRDVISPDLRTYTLTLLEAGSCSGMATADIVDGKIAFIYWLCEKCC